MSGKYLKGAFVEFLPTFAVPVPNVIIFQYNPETITHTWEPPAAAGDSPGFSRGLSNPLAVQGLPGETFGFTLSMDSNDTIADGGAAGAGIATGSGIYSRLAALEMLQFPTGGTGAGLLGQASAALVGLFTDPVRTVPEFQVPTVLFVWGPGRILPVRVESLSVTEKLYDPLLLHPTHAEAEIGLRVLTPDEIRSTNGPLRLVAKGADAYTQTLRETLALANAANAVESVIGMLPV